MGRGLGTKSQLNFEHMRPHLRPWKDKEFSKVTGLSCTTVQVVHCTKGYRVVYLQSVFGGGQYTLRSRSSCS